HGVGQAIDTTTNDHIDHSAAFHPSASQWHNYKLPLLLSDSKKRGRFNASYVLGHSARVEEAVETKLKKSEEVTDQ
ncbi:hypothetical protein, partial [Xanthomonas vasicola]|uniref:hypothetical protein n=1 Tax=Xanthomonas vasicola TaxID=56459 RepID=UPI001C96B299